MSRLREMIEELCPDGVEYRKLEDVLKICNGSDYKKFGEGDIPVYGSGGIMTYIDTYVYDKPSVLIPRKGSLDKLYYVDVPFWTVDTIFYTKISEEVLPKYVFYYLQSQHLEHLNKAGGVPSLTQTILNKVLIPVPPLPIQNEIVKLLDNFTELTAELTAELLLRKKQYNFYRDSLLNFVRVDDTIVQTDRQTDRQTALRIGEFRAFCREFVVEYCRLGDIAEIVRGNGLQKCDFTEEGIGCIHYGQIYTKYGTFANKTLSFVPVELATKLKRVSSGDLVVAITSENVEDICKCVAWLGNDDIVTGGHAAIIKHQQNSKYLAYVFQTEDFFRQKRKFVVGTKVIEMSPKKLAEIVIPIPPLEVQAKIVSILDRFDALCNDLTQGLPAEIAARKKQYEYYRDKLLTFRRKEESVRSGQ